MHKVKIELEFEQEPTRQEVIDVIKSDKFWFELVSPPKYDKDKFDKNYEAIFGKKKKDKDGDKGKKSNSR